MLFMKKNLIKGMVALCVCAAFASCSKDPGYEVASNPAELAKIQYKEAFIKKYGPIAANQSWDFSSYAVTTRGQVLPAMTWNQQGFGGGTGPASHDAFKQTLTEDAEEVMAKAVSSPEVLFPYTYSSMHLRPAFAHGYNTNYNYYGLGAEYTTDKGTVSTNVKGTYVNAKYNARLDKDVWYVVGGESVVSTCSNMNFNTWREINTIPCVNANSARWWVYAKAALSGEYEKKTVTHCKLFTVKGRNYIAFDCDGDRDYTDFICQYQLFDYRQKEEPKAYGKRYMVEDLGTTDDFDFNDIVFDVVQLADGSQKCYVRALGGIYNVTITIGNTTWSKTGSEIMLGDETVIAEEGVMYNTKPIHSDWILAEFPVTGWDPTGNDVYVTVFTRGQNGEFYTNTIEFPELSEVPMMVAVSTDKVWMVERESILSIPESFINDNVYELSGE